MKGSNIIITFISFIISTVLTYFVRKRAIKKSWLDIPNHRSSHTIPTPRGGGLAIAITFSLGIAYLGFEGIMPMYFAYALIIGGSIVSSIGYLDDRYNIVAQYRLLAHFAGAGIALYYLNIDYLAIMPHWIIDVNAFIYLLLLFATVWLINLFNFMDGIDGLAAGETVSTSIATGLFLMSAHPDLASACWELAATAAGFLVWNWPPAKIFMGDVSSGLLGFVFAIFCIYSASNDYLAVSCWMILLAVYIVDASLTLVRRVIAGEKWYAAHRSHAYQRLIQSGMSHLQVTSMILIYNIVFLLPLAWVTTVKPELSLLIMIIAYTVTIAIWLRIVSRIKLI